MVYLSDFMDEIDIVCPQCTSHAKVLVLGNSYEQRKYKLSCLQCGYTKTVKNPWLISSSHGIMVEAIPSFNQPKDPFFELELWYQKSVASNILWAYNLRHLVYLEEYISSRHFRGFYQPKFPFANASLVSRLPKWMQSKKNRENILRAINDLKSK